MKDRSMCKIRFSWMYKVTYIVGYNLYIIDYVSCSSTEKKNQVVKKAKHAKRKADGKQTGTERKKDL